MEFLGNQSHDQKARDDEEDVNADKSTRRKRKACVEENDEDDGDRAETVDLGPVAQARNCVLGAAVVSAEACVHGFVQMRVQARTPSVRWRAA